MSLSVGQSIVVDCIEENSELSIYLCPKPFVLHIPLFILFSPILTLRALVFENERS